MIALLMTLLMGTANAEDVKQEVKHWPNSYYETWDQNGFEMFKLETPELKCVGFEGAIRFKCSWHGKEWFWVGSK